MARPRSVIPKMCIDKSRNRAFCKVKGRFVSLGPAGSSEAQIAYGKLLARLAAGETLESAKAETKAIREKLTINELLIRYATEEMPRYSKDEQWCQRSAIRAARTLFGETPVEEFGPLKLRLVRTAMIEKGWSRRFINKQVGRLRSIFRWGVSWELVPQAAADALKSMKALSPGDSDAPEYRPRHALPDEALQAVKRHLKPAHQDLFDLLLMTGARPGELTPLKIGQIDRSGEVWRADLVKHKTAHKGKSRTLFFNPTAQLILVRYMKDDPNANLFSVTRSALSNAIKRACEVAFGMPDELRKRRRSPARDLTGDELKSEEDRRKKAIEWRRECVFTAHWLRHCSGTRVANQSGDEAAQRFLGHSDRAMTLHYSAKAEKLAIEAVKKLG